MGNNTSNYDMINDNESFYIKINEYMKKNSFLCDDVSNYDRAVKHINSFPELCNCDSTRWKILFDQNHKERVDIETQHCHHLKRFTANLMRLEKNRNNAFQRKCLKLCMLYNLNVIRGKNSEEFLKRFTKGL